MTPSVLAIDLGGTTIKGAIVDAAGHRHVSQAVPTFPADGNNPLSQLLVLLDRLRAAAPRLDLHPEAAGIVVPGIVDAGGRVAFASNLGWRDFDLRGVLERHLHVPVAIGHDVRAAGLAEASLGAARGERDVLLVTIGTGIAAAFLAAGQEILGAGHAAGEIGHIPVIPDGDACACGQFGCMEAYASAAAIARRYKAQGGSDLSTEAIAARVATDPLAGAIWGEAVRALSLGLATATLLLDPAVIVVGGGLSRAGAVLLDPLRVALQSRLAWREAPPLRPALLGAAGGQMGAAILALRAVDRGGLVAGWGPTSAPP